MGQAPAPPHMLLLGAGEGSAALEHIARMPDATIHRADQLPAAEAVLRRDASAPVDLVVIGPDLDRPLVVARQVLRMSPHSQLVFVPRKEELKPLSERLAFLPDLSGAWAVDAEAGADELRPMVAEAVELSRARRRAAALPERLNRMLGRSDMAPRPGPGPTRAPLWQSFFSAVLSQVPDPIFATDPDGALLTWNDAAVALFGADPEEAGGSGRSFRLPERWLGAIGGLLARAASGERIAQHEVRVPRADGTEIDLSLSLAPARDERDRVIYISFVARDVSEQKHLEAQQQLLIRELNHRVKNVLALVHSVARRTAQHAGSVDDFLAAFQGRLQAMSAAHGLLSDSWWHGASLPELARAVLDPLNRDDRIGLALPELHLPPRLASSLALVLNELGTNAARYGALSGEEGRVTLSGREIAAQGQGEAGRRLELEWREEGGPVVTRPGRSGFGTRLIEQLVTYQHSGAVEMDWAETGLTCRLAMSLEEPSFA